MARVPKLEPFDLPPGVRDVPGRASKPAGATADRELVRRAQREDQEAFAELVRRHQHRVFAVAGGILRRREDVEDIAQQVFVKAYFSLKRFDQRAAFSTWLYKITVNECWRSEEHTSELQSRLHLVCRLLLEKKKKYQQQSIPMS